MYLFGTVLKKKKKIEGKKKSARVNFRKKSF